MCNEWARGMGIGKGNQDDFFSLVSLALYICDVDFFFLFFPLSVPECFLMILPLPISMLMDIEMRATNERMGNERDTGAKI
jgi:hypothetical protein